MGEYSKSNKRAFIVSFTQIGTAGGLLLGSLFGLLLSQLISPADLSAWGWRIAFLFGIVVAIFGLYMRRQLDETPAFKKSIEEKTISKNPLAEAFKSHKREMITVFCCISGTHVAYWLNLSYMSTYINQFLKLPITMGFALNSVIILTFMIVVPFAAKAADKFGRKKLMLLGSGCITLLEYPLFSLLKKADTTFEMIGICMLLAILLTFLQGCASVAMTELFPTKVRVSGFSVPYQLSAAAFGGTALLVATWLLKATNNVMVVPIYISAAMFTVFLSVFFLYPETKDLPYDR